MAIKKRAPRKRLEVEETDFVYRVIESSSICLAPEEVEDPEYSTGKKLHPAKEYAIEVYSRTIPLVDRIYSLNEIFWLLDVTTFPVKLGGMGLSRFEWLRLIVDLIHVRFTSIRDSAILIAAGVLRISQNPRALRISSLERAKGADKIIKILWALESMGKEIRKARNLSFHQSEFFAPGLSEFEQHVFRGISKCEAFRDLHPTSKTTLTEMYARTHSHIAKEYERETKEVVRELRKLFKLLDVIFVETLNKKFDRP